MKKIISLVLVTMMCISLCACGGSESVNGDNADKITNESKKENATQNSVLVEIEGVVCIKKDKFGEILERVELTTENWKDYIRIHSYEEEVIEKDEFGDIVSKETVTRYCIGAVNDKYYRFQDVLIELKHKETGKVTVVNPYASCLSGALDLNDFECTRIKGYLYFVDIPQEAIYSPLPAGEYDTGFWMVGDGSYHPYEVNAITKEIKTSGSWDEYFE